MAQWSMESEKDRIIGSNKPNRPNNIQTQFREEILSTNKKSVGSKRKIRTDFSIYTDSADDFIFSTNFKLFCYVVDDEMRFYKTENGSKVLVWPKRQQAKYGIKNELVQNAQASIDKKIVAVCLSEIVNIKRKSFC